MTKSVFLFSTLSLAFLFSACTAATNQRLDDMNTNMGKLSTQIEGYQTHVKSLDENSSRIAKETETYEEILRSLATQAERIAGSLDQFQKMGERFTQQIQEATKTDQQVTAQQNQANPPNAASVGAADAGASPNSASPTPQRAEPQGPQIKFGEGFCVSRDARSLYTQLINYDGYSKMPGAKYAIGNFGALIQMTSSKANFTLRNDNESSADAAIVLQPITVTDSKLFPRLTIHCDAKWTSPNSFEHQCFLDQAQPHFGLSNVISYIKAENGVCKNGQTRVGYQLILQTNEAEVLMIKDRVVTNFKALGPIIAKFFNEEMFFKAYFRNLYNGLIQNQN